jgi:hypothetical protein
VKFSPGFNLLIAGLLPLTIGLKLALAPSSNADNGIEQVERFLRKNAFTITGNRLLIDIQIVEARRPDCQLSVGLLSPYGADSTLFQGVGSPTDQHFVVFRGQIYDRQPSFMTASWYLWARSLYQLGISIPVPHVFGLASSCDPKKFSGVTGCDSK